jgi:hypothetical protein
MANNTVTYSDSYADGEIGTFDEITLRGVANGRLSTTNMAVKYSAAGTAVVAVVAKAATVAAKIVSRAH